MKIIKNVRSSQQQEQVRTYGNTAHVLVAEREVIIKNQDGTSQTQYEYDEVIVENCNIYLDVVEVATNYRNEVIKGEQLEKITVTTTSGKVFYADPISRTDISDAISLANETSQTSTTWKLAEPIDGSKLAIVTLDELKEARALGLQAKASIIGV